MWVEEAWVFGDRPKELPQKIRFLLLPDFSLMAYASTVEPLREANWVTGRALYEWQILSEDGQPVRASNGMTVGADAPMGAVTNCSTLIVCSSFDPHLYVTAAMLAWLRRIGRLGADLGAVDTGSYVLARAGLLEGYRATIHWENVESIASVFDDVWLTHSIFEIDRNRFSCSGGTAGLDMMLYLIRKQHGHEVAVTVAEEFIYNRMREPGDPQRMAVSHRLGIAHPKLITAIEAMELALDEPLSSPELAASAGISEREMQRLFRAHLGTTPKAYYRGLRLSRARMMLRQTTQPVMDIALSCGFRSAADFARCYRACYGRAPSSDRHGSDR